MKLRYKQDAHPVHEIFKDKQPRRGALFVEKVIKLIISSVRSVLLFRQNKPSLWGSNIDK